MSTPITDKVIARARALGVTVLTHAQWDAKYRTVYAWRVKNKPAKQPADTVVQHITVTLDHGPLTGDFKRDVRTVEQIGYARFGSGISYNWLVDMETGMVAAGMPLEAKGTHTINDKNVSGYSYDQNYAARAIAVLGMPNSKLSKAAEQSITLLLRAMVDAGAITKGFDYDPHSKFAWKDCPCDATRDRMKAIRAAVDKVAEPKPAAPQSRPNAEAVLAAAEKGVRANADDPAARSVFVKIRDLAKTLTIGSK